MDAGEEALRAPSKHKAIAKVRGKTMWGKLCTLCSSLNPPERVEAPSRPLNASARSDGDVHAGRPYDLMALFSADEKQILAPTTFAVPPALSVAQREAPEGTDEEPPPYPSPILASLYAGTDMAQEDPKSEEQLDALPKLLNSGLAARRGITVRGFAPEHSSRHGTVTRVRVSRRFRMKISRLLPTVIEEMEDIGNL
jgi:hypothetical protein